MKAPRFWAAVFLATSVIGCGPSGREAQLSGSWQLAAAMGTQTFTFSDDHTYIMTTPQGSGTGDWKIDGNRLIVTAKTSMHKSDVGKEGTYEIVKLDNSVLILKLKGQDESGEEALATFTRVK